MDFPTKTKLNQIRANRDPPVKSGVKLIRGSGQWEDLLKRSIYNISCQLMSIANDGDTEYTFVVKYFIRDAHDHNLNSEEFDQACKDFAIDIQKRIEPMTDLPIVIHDNGDFTMSWL